MKVIKYQKLLFILYVGDGVGGAEICSFWTESFLGLIVFSLFSLICVVNIKLFALCGHKQFVLNATANSNLTSSAREDRALAAPPLSFVTWAKFQWHSCQLVGQELPHAPRSPAPSLLPAHSSQGS